MKSKALGGISGFLLVLAAAATAEAQTITITGEAPGCVTTSDSQATYQATISNVSGCNFRLWVFKNGVQKYASPQTWVSGTSPFTVSHLVTGLSGWGLQAGQELKFRGRAWIASGASMHDLIRYVEQGGSTYLPSDDRRPTPAGVRGELYAAVLNDDEELLA
jgi:hypothetical protein